VELKEICTKYVAFLRALYLLHQNHHWLAKGNDFYGNHLLFERLYKSAQENADVAAEKFIGLFGSESLGVATHPKLLSELLEKYTSESFVNSSLEAEKDFLDFSNKIYSEFKDNLKDKLSLGLDDMIMSIASQREESVYLLQQASGEGVNKLSGLAAKFQKKLA
jgi:DNA-binding ferritin-like protein